MCIRDSPWIKDVELTTHGFGVMEIDRSRAQMNWFYVKDVMNPASSVYPAFSWYTRVGQPKLRRA